MRILILYHSNIIPQRPGADEHIYTTAKLLSEYHSVTVLTWGPGTSKVFNDANLTVIHQGWNKDKIVSASYNKIPQFVVDIVAYLGIYYIFFLRKAKGPSFGKFNRLELGKFDIALRVSFDSNKILKHLKKYSDTKLIELALVGGLPHYVKNLKEWLAYTNSFPPISIKILNAMYRIMQKVVFSFYISTLSSRDVIVISKHDEQILKMASGLRVKYLPPIHDFNPESSESDRNDTVLFFSGKSMAARIAVEYIVHIAQKLPEINFSITGLSGNDLKNDIIPPNVKLHGYIGDDQFHRLLKNSAIVVMPLISGSGFQTKLAEALSKGKPVITTSVIANEFPGITNGEHVLIEDDPTEFFKKIELLINDRDLREKLMRNALEYYKRNLRSEVALDQTLGYLSELMHRE